MARETKAKKIYGVRQRTHESVDKIMDKAEGMRQIGKERMAHVKEKAIMMKGNVDGYIRKNPEKSVLIAAGIGAVIGAVLAAAMMRRRQ
ncbi:MAG: DUF883 C-terminal domain-containing protein [Candidatus Woesearchaeota archaeon]